MTRILHTPFKPGNLWCFQNNPAGPRNSHRNLGWSSVYLPHLIFPQRAWLPRVTSRSCWLFLFLWDPIAGLYSDLIMTFSDLRYLLKSRTVLAVLPYPAINPFFIPVCQGLWFCERDTSTGCLLHEPQPEPGTSLQLRCVPLIWLGSQQSKKRKPWFYIILFPFLHSLSSWVGRTGLGFSSGPEFSLSSFMNKLSFYE